MDISDEIDQLSKKSNQLTKDIYSNLTPWQITKIARPYQMVHLDYVREIFTKPLSLEMHGDRHFATINPSSAAWPASMAKPAW